MNDHEHLPALPKEEYNEITHTHSNIHGFAEKAIKFGRFLSILINILSLAIGVLYIVVIAEYAHWFFILWAVLLWIFILGSFYNTFLVFKIAKDMKTLDVVESVVGFAGAIDQLICFLVSAVFGFLMKEYCAEDKGIDNQYALLLTISSILCIISLPGLLAQAYVFWVGATHQDQVLLHYTYCAVLNLLLYAWGCIISVIYGYSANQTYLNNEVPNIFLVSVTELTIILIIVGSIIYVINSGRLVYIFSILGFFSTILGVIVIIISGVLVGKAKNAAILFYNSYGCSSIEEDNVSSNCNVDVVISGELSFKFILIWGLEIGLYSIALGVFGLMVLINKDLKLKSKPKIPVIVTYWICYILFMVGGLIAITVIAAQAIEKHC